MELAEGPAVKLLPLSLTRYCFSWTFLKNMLDGDVDQVKLKAETLIV
jgi:hypothetical protein